MAIVGSSGAGKSSFVGLLLGWHRAAAGRVLVVDGGWIAEDDNPRALAARSASLYRELLEAEDSVREGLWSNDDWRRVPMESGQLVEERNYDGDMQDKGSYGFSASLSNHSNGSWGMVKVRHTSEAPLFLESPQRQLEDG